MHPSYAPLSLAFDRRIAVAKGGSVRYLVATVMAPPASSSVGLPLDLALVLDTSGSMSGAPLEAVRQGAARVVAELRPEDRLSIVAFGSEARTLLHAVAMTPEGRRAAGAAIAALDTDGCTNLATGWVQGAELLGQGEAGRLRHVVLMTDGHANEGETDPTRLGELAAQLREAGVTTSAVGVGDGWVTAQIEPIAGHGGGRLHHAGVAGEVVQVLEGELQDVRATVVRDAVLELDAPPSVRVTRLDGSTAFLGALAGDVVRHVVWKVECPAGPLGATLPFAVRLRWRALDVVTPTVVAEVRAELILGDYAQSDGQPRNPATRELVAMAWQSVIVRDVVRLEREGDRTAAQRHLDHELRHFKRFVAGLGAARALVDELRALRGSLEAAWAESQRKEVEVAHWKRSRNERDTRGTRPEWTSHLPGR